MFGTLDLRMRQLYRALGDLHYHETSFKVTRTERPGSVSIGVNFNEGVSEEELANAVSLFIANIASLKDHLKAWCHVRGLPFEGDTLINSNRDVAIIHDLWNRDKHAGLKQSRSGLFPELRDLKRALVLKAKPKAERSTIQIDVSNGLVNAGKGLSPLMVTAKVVDQSGQLLGSLDRIADRAIAEWEQAVVRAGCALPPR